MLWYDGLIFAAPESLSESSLAYAVPHDSYPNREVQGVHPAQCVLVPFSAPCIGCGECK